MSTNKRKTYKLNSPAGATWTGGDLNYTIYIDICAGQFLPEKGCSVLGVVERLLFSGEQLVLMTCEDRKIYHISTKETSCSPYSGIALKRALTSPVRELLLWKGFQRHSETLKPSSGLPVWSNRI